MFPYSPTSNPAVRSHLDSQLAWFNDLNQALAYGAWLANASEATLALP